MNSKYFNSQPQIIKGSGVFRKPGGPNYFGNFGKGLLYMQNNLKETHDATQYILPLDYTCDTIITKPCKYEFLL